MQKNRINFKIIPAYQAEKEELIPETTLGIEVTVPAIAAKCGLGNIDHHGVGCTSNTYSACEQVYIHLCDWKYAETFFGFGAHPEQGGLKNLCKSILEDCQTVVGNILDADTLTAMGVIKIATEPGKHSVNHEYLSNLVYMIGLIDRLGASSAREVDGSKYAEHSLVEAIIAIAESRTMNLNQQIHEVVQILTIQEVSSVAKKAVEESGKLFNEAKIASKITKLDNGIVLVESEHDAATRIGYQHGDVLICLNEKMKKDFKNPEAGTYRKFTVCKRDENVQAVIDFDQLNELEKAEGTWGGRSTVGGSPQGVDSTLTVEQVAGCIHTSLSR